MEKSNLTTHDEPNTRFQYHFLVCEMYETEIHYLNDLNKRTFLSDRKKSKSTESLSLFLLVIVFTRITFAHNIIGCCDRSRNQNH